MPVVTYSLQNEHIGVITLNDPVNLNAMSDEMAQEFASLVASLHSNSPRVLVLRGEGRAFSAGGHLSMLERKIGLPGEKNRQNMLWFYHAFLGIRALKVPLIAAVHGATIGAGLCLACACDIRIAAASSKLGFTFSRLGLHPGLGATFLVPLIIGSAAASELLLSGKVIEAEEARRLGLVSRIVPDDLLMQEVLACAAEILSCGPEVTRQLTATLRLPDAELERALEREALCQSINYSSSEFAEGLKALKEKRKPNF